MRDAYIIMWNFNIPDDGVSIPQEVNTTTDDVTGDRVEDTAGATTACA